MVLRSQSIMLRPIKWKPTTATTAMTTTAANNNGLRAATVAADIHAAAADTLHPSGQPAPMRHPTPAAPTHGLGGSGGARPPRHAAQPGTPASLPAAAPRPEAPAAPGVAKGVHFP